MCWLVEFVCLLVRPHVCVCVKHRLGEREEEEEEEETIDLHTQAHP